MVSPRSKLLPDGHPLAADAIMACTDVVSPVAAQAKKRNRTFSDSDVASSVPMPPCPPQRPQQLLFGMVEGEVRGRPEAPAPMDPPVPRTDIFRWMRCENPAEDPEVSKLLHDENAYSKAMLAHLETLQEELYSEMLSHQVESE